MRRRGLVVAMALTLAAAACAGSDAVECDAVVTEAVGQVQILLDQVDQMTLEQLAEIDSTFTADFEASIDALEQRADDANCSNEELEDLFRDKIGTLSAESEFGQLFVEQFTTDNLFDE